MNSDVNINVTLISYDKPILVYSLLLLTIKSFKTYNKYILSNTYIIYLIMFIIWIICFYPFTILIIWIVY